MIENDIQHNGVPKGEFVVSQMTKAVSNAIRYAFEHYDLIDAPALDIGTGTGYHTLLYLSMGHPSVFSIDINEQAIQFARERVRNFYPTAQFYSCKKLEDFMASSVGEASTVNFYPHSLNDIAAYKDNKYAIVSFNPPILYPFFEIQFDKPATQGVYFETDNVKDKENDLVYGFYENIAQHNLAKGAHILCVWASLNRHLVELNPFGAKVEGYVHPARILENWFGFEFDNEAESFEDFYRHTTVLQAGFFNQENTGELYSKNIRFGLEQHYYSQLLLPGKSENLAGTQFNFGILHLVKTSDSENRFRIVNGSSKDRTTHE